MMISPWDEGTRLYERALDVRSGIHETIASNMANEETPGYKARELPFHQTLHALLSGQEALEVHRSHPKHLALYDPNGNLFHHTIHKEEGAGLDHNTVNLEKEMTLMAENTLMYMAVSQFLDRRLKAWKSAIDEGRGG
jgi:flagellar basal-body rod protein FlgB